ncbi:ribbon-helix-helix domain-containing protein [Novosphingobium sp. G106]|uniref:ribbon-helix-helix domain-containing protein n=1 Tax=Novosphingobium sp. G106 TaxID=2849500 RepID=UPI001C2D23F2|nr:CopG family transcriptional regulator [Novosphingobium sp. G106]MBV1686470.1 ribbon-helix-helix domain-containing protein [Novosphingobium sp. G106]
MPRLTIRLDDELYDRLIDRSRTTGTTPSAYLRDLLVRFEGTDPLGYHARFDDIYATTLQTMAMLGTWMAQVAPKAFEDGITEARALLVEHGLPVIERPE